MQTVSDSRRPLFLVINLFLSFLVLVFLLPPLFKTTEGVVVLFQISDMTSDGLGEMFEGDSAPQVTQPPIDSSGNFPAHMSAESPSNISPNPLEVISKVSEP